MREDRVEAGAADQRRRPGQGEAQADADGDHEDAAVRLRRALPRLLDLGVADVVAVLPQPGGKGAFPASSANLWSSLRLNPRPSPARQLGILPGVSPRTRLTMPSTATAPSVATAPTAISPPRITPIDPPVT